MLNLTPILLTNFQYFYSKYCKFGIFYNYQNLNIVSRAIRVTPFITFENDVDIRSFIGSILLYNI